MSGSTLKVIKHLRNRQKEVYILLGVTGYSICDENIHDRSTSLDNGWKIILGRGLDIFQKTGGWFDIAEYDQELRQCKAGEVTYVFGR